MRISDIKKATLLAVVLAGTSVLAVAPAAAQGGLLDTIFGRGNRMNQPAAAQQAEKPAPAKAPVRKVSGPAYYNYKAAPLVDVDFSPVVTAEAGGLFEPRLDGATFRDALAGLDDFALSAEKEIGEALTRYYAQNRDFIWISG